MEEISEFSAKLEENSKARAAREWEALLGDDRDLTAARPRRRTTQSSSGSGAEGPRSRDRGVAGRLGTADPGSRSGTCGTRDGGHDTPRDRVTAWEARSSSKIKRSAGSSARDGPSDRTSRRRTVAVRSGLPGAERLTTLKEDPRWWP